MTIPKNRRKLSLAAAAAVLRDQGLTLGASTYDPVTQTVVYLVTDAAGAVQALTAAEVKRIVYQKPR